MNPTQTPNLEYYEGKECQCCAHNASECACSGVDWTPKEVYKLRAELAAAEEWLNERYKALSEADEKIEQIERDLAEKTNEVARLRELLNRAIEIADEAITPLQRSEYNMDGDMLYRQLERLRDELAALAPATEEPVVVNPKQSNLVVDQKNRQCEQQRLARSWP